MTVTLNRESIQVKRDLQRRVENWVIDYCNALEDNFKQYSITQFSTRLCKSLLTLIESLFNTVVIIKKIEFRLYIPIIVENQQNNRVCQGMNKFNFQMSESL